MKLLIARFNGKTVMTMTLEEALAVIDGDAAIRASAAGTLERIRGAFSGAKTSPARLKSSDTDWLAMQDIENGWTRTTAERPKVAG